MELVETRVFTRQVTAELTEDEYREMQVHLLTRPDAGAVIPGSGGLRKVRWKLSGRGKRGGARVIYYWYVAEHQIFLLFLYPKNVRGDLSLKEIRTLRGLVEEP